MNTQMIASWLLTYLIHSTVFLGAAWLVSRALGDRRLALQEVLLRTALIGGLLTSSVQLVLGLIPAAGVFSVAAADGFALTDTAPEAAIVSTRLSDLEATIPPTRSTASFFGSNAYATALLLLWCAGSLAALLALGRSIQDLRRLLQTRNVQPASRLVERLAAAMGLRKPVQLSTSKAIAVPFATGVRQPEICCPERVNDLAPEHKTGLYAHELAHLARRDPAWQLLYRLGEAIFVLQPLNRVVRRRLEEIAEHLTDECAVSCTGSRLGLARCLVVVAHWGHGSRVGVPATAFASGPRLDRRVRRLLEDSPAEKAAPLWAAPLAAALLAAAALTLPLVAAGPADAEAFSESPEPSTTKTWSDADDAPPVPPEPPAEPEIDESSGPPPAVPAPPREAVTVESPPTPPTPPEAETPPEPALAPEPQTAPEPVKQPEPNVVPVQEAQPAPPAPDTSPEERAARRAHERERAAFASRVKEAERARVRAEEMERSSVERSRAMAVRQAERVREQHVRQEELAREIAERQAVAEARAAERALDAQRSSAERTRKAAAREAQRLQLQREREAETARRAAEDRLEREMLAHERAVEDMERARKRAEERSRVLEEEARRLAERAEAERQAIEELERRKAEKNRRE